MVALSTVWKWKNQDGLVLGPVRDQMFLELNNLKKQKRSEGAEYARQLKTLRPYGAPKFILA